jgi:hypothetical protein
MSNKNAIYAMTVGKYGSLKEPLVKSKGWDYILYTDNKELKSDIWDIRPLFKEYESINDPKRIAMMHRLEFYKLFEGSSYENIVCVHGDVLITNDLNDFLNEYELDNNNYDVAFMWHPKRNCVYKEAKEVYNRKLDYPKLVNTVVNKYLTEGYPRNNGLFATGLIVMKNNNDNCINLFKTWSNEYVNGSRRDQLSVNYALWKYRKNGNNINVKVMPWAALGSGKYIKHYWHNNTKGRSIDS